MWQTTKLTNILSHTTECDIAYSIQCALLVCIDWHTNTMIIVQLRIIIQRANTLPYFGLECPSDRFHSCPGSGWRVDTT